VRATEDRLDNEILRHFSTTSVNGRDYPEATVALPCGAEYSLQITITPDLGSVNLGLRNAQTNRVAEMGWWDDARWHPHGLRWSELETLHQYWGNSLERIHPSAGFLLLALFVGHGAHERHDFAARKETIAKHYQQLQLFTSNEIAELVERTFVLPCEEDYNWSQDDELGWVFGGEYPCYSIRNREHSGGAEGRFPFSDWTMALAKLPEG
jgi:hypothetical protein